MKRAILVLALACPLLAATRSTDKRLQHWAVQPVRKNFDGAASIDDFIREKLAEKGLAMAREADRRTLIRRLSFDLLGLPPAPERVERFVRDGDPGAYEKLVDEMLASPHYGERWARHWLDIAHYADTHGFERDQLRPNAWRYRDYVIDSFNADKPYDRFLREQIAGDVIAPNDPAAVTATGFLAAGPWDYVGQVETKSAMLRRAARAGDLDDMVTQVITATMGITINCARCHDHKLDPITQEEYYRLRSVFAGVRRGDREVSAGGAQHLKVYAVISDPLPPPIKIQRRGDPEDEGPTVLPGAFAWARHAPRDFGDNNTPEGERRRALAEWITRPSNPLTARVLVNRLWHHHFGKGLVSTPSDFGLGGDRPSHPELLDWIANEFVRGGWSIKHMQKLIVMSATYRQTSTLDLPKAVALDSDNRLLWRQNPRRLDAESLHDAVLSVAGTLNLEMGGPGYRDFDYTEAYAPIYRYITPDKPALWRRSIYRFVVRTTPQPFMSTLDCPNPANLTPARVTTTTALQALTLSNDAFMLEQARYLAARIEGQGGDREACISRAFRLCFQRPPTVTEFQAADRLVAGQGLFALCRMLLNANEFVYID